MERDRRLDVRQRLRNKGVRKLRERGCTRHAVKQLVKDKLLYNGKVPVNAELSPLKREKPGTEVQRYGTLNEAMKM